MTYQIPDHILPALAGRPEIPEHLVEAILKPHDHETEHNKPIWLIWRHIVSPDGLSDGPQLDTVCDNLDQAFWSTMLLIEDKVRMTRGTAHVYVERIPANHRFASSMSEVFHEHLLGQVKVLEKFRYKREGD